MTEPVIRLAQPTDDLTELYQEAGALSWNCSNLMVAAEDNHIIGGLVFWDSGHPIVYVAHFRVLEAHRGNYIGFRLMEAVEGYARENGKTAVIGMADDLDYIATARRMGARVSPHPYYLLMRDIE